MRILELFCSVDDFWQQFAPNWQGSLLAAGKRQRLRTTHMHSSEMMTILILFHESHYRTFKAYCTEYVQRHLRSEFPTQVSYQRFVEVMPTLLVPLVGQLPSPVALYMLFRSLTSGTERKPTGQDLATDPLVAYLHTQLGRCSGISFIDSTSLSVCRNPRIQQHRVFAGRAARGKTSVGWFYGFKLHLVVNDQGELLAFCLTAGNVDDRRPVPKLAKQLFGKLFGDKGYLSQPLMEDLLVTQGVQLITKLRKRMRNRLLEMSDKLLLRKRAIIETINDQLKNIWKTRAFTPSQSHQFPGQSGRRADCLLPPAQETVSRIAAPRTCRGLAYPELT